MWSSARRSSSAVDTPGRSSDSTSARTSATTRPARRIVAISADVLTMTWRVRATATSDAADGAGEGAQNCRGDVVDLRSAVDGRQHALRAVVVHDLLER